MIHWFRTIDYCFWFSFNLLTCVNFLHFLDNDDRMALKRRNLSALVFPIKIETSSKNIKPRINLNHNIIIHYHNLETCQITLKPVRKTLKQG